MSGSADLELFLSAEVRSIAEACTTCARCVEVCPVTPEAHIGAADVKPAVTGVLALLTGGEALGGPSRRWVDRCNGCGECIESCPEGVNPRRMLMFAQCVDARTGNGVPQVFPKLARAVRLMAAMQLAPEDMDRLFNHRLDGPCDVVFYTGCNALRTPHVLLNAMQILDALQVRYQVAGGPANCCGIAHTRTQGNITAGGNVLGSTLVRFESSGAPKVLSWCPSCQLQMDETWRGYQTQPFELDHVTSFLAEQGERLTARFNTPVQRRVVLHAHAGLESFGRNVERLLGAVPGLTVVDTIIETGYTCGVAGSARSPALTGDDRERLAGAVHAGGADVVVSLYHSCHRSLLADAERLGVGVVNFTDLLVEALGGEPAGDRYVRLHGIDARDVLDETQAFLEANGIELGADWFEANYDELRGMAEYRGGLACFAR